jgi:hypothetical protein
MAPSPVVRMHGRDRSGDRDAIRFDAGALVLVPPSSARPPGMHVICYEPPTTGTERCVSCRWLRCMRCKLMRDFSLLASIAQAQWLLLLYMNR